MQGLDDFIILFL